MRREIGSDFWLTKAEYLVAQGCNDEVEIPFSFPNIVLTNLCRTGLELYLDGLGIENGVALVPEFTCQSVVDPFTHHTYKTYGYPLNRDFSIDKISLENLAKTVSPDVILLHNYFGFETINIQVKRLFPNAIIIDDLTQRFLSTFPTEDADCYVGSIRKWMPVPDGGFYGGNIKLDLDNSEHEEFINLELNALLDKGEYIEGNCSDKTKFREAFSKARASLGNQERYCSMALISKKIYNLTPLDNWKKTRQDNGKYLSERLMQFDFLDVPLHEINEETTPFLIPVLVKDKRNEFQSYLAKNDIYATVIWTCPDALKNIISINGQYIYDHILCFHCDQRYAIDDMQRIIDVIKEYQASKYE